MIGCLPDRSTLRSIALFAATFACVLRAEAFDLPPVTAVTVAKDSKPVEIRAPDPRAYALIERVLAGKAEAPRAAYAAALVKERWPEKFDEADEAAFEEADDDMAAPPRV